MQTNQISPSLLAEEPHELKITSCWIVGAGAIGAALAVLLSQVSDVDVTLVADAGRCARYSREGFVINGTRHVLPVATPQKLLTPSPDSGEKGLKLLIFAVKHQHLKEAAEMTAPLAGEDTVVLSLLNGISSEEDLKPYFGAASLLYALTVGQDAVRQGNSINFTRQGKIIFGNKKNDPMALDPRVSAIMNYFLKAGVDCLVPEDMEQELWWKFLVNTGINQASAVFRAPYGAFQKEGKARDLMLALQYEVMQTAAHEGIELNEAALNRWLKLLSTLSPEGKTSMLQDVEAGRKTEVALFGGTLLALAKRHGVSVPWNELVVAAILKGEQWEV